MGDELRFVAIEDMSLEYPGTKQTVREKLPVRRIGEPDDLAAAHVFLMKQHFATGQSIVIDGGGLLVWRDLQASIAGSGPGDQREREGAKKEVSPGKRFHGRRPSDGSRDAAGSGIFIVGAPDDPEFPLG
ncbi:hypothetical protein [Acidomonas methanolica]|uniref:hypothetical protein n=1 Tax=Acidomonas methanolica TaxID=437 RepID=UPI00211A34C1|nr:hypothetical protein [Acidomonas methanolica]MCQ9157212.1 hypothetical protein [Acidomonas methanolica]